MKLAIMRSFCSTIGGCVCDQNEILVLSWNRTLVRSGHVAGLASAVWRLPAAAANGVAAATLATVRREIFAPMTVSVDDVSMSCFAT